LTLRVTTSDLTARITDQESLPYLAQTTGTTRYPRELHQADMLTTMATISDLMAKTMDQSDVLPATDRTGEIQMAMDQMDQTIATILMAVAVVLPNQTTRSLKKEAKEAVMLMEDVRVQAVKNQNAKIVENQLNQTIVHSVQAVLMEQGVHSVLMGQEAPSDQDHLVQEAQEDLEVQEDQAAVLTMDHTDQGDSVVQGDPVVQEDSVDVLAVQEDVAALVDQVG